MTYYEGKQQRFYYLVEYEDKKNMKWFKELDTYTGYRKNVWYFAYDAHGWWSCLWDDASYTYFSKMRKADMDYYFPYGQPSGRDYEEQQK